MALSTKNLVSNYVSWQVKGFMGPRVEHQYTDFDEDGVMQGKGGLQFMGNITKASLQLTPEKLTHVESFTGDRNTDVTWTRKRSGKISLTIEDLTTKQNLSAQLGGTPKLISTGSATGVFLVSINATEPTFRPLKTGLPTVGVKYALGYRADNGTWQPYKNIASTTLVVTDSAGTPATLALNTNYSVVSWRQGWIVFNDVTGFTGPIKAAFTYGLVKDKLPNNINMQLYYKLSHQNVSNIVLKDAAGTPVIVNTAYYDVDLDFGLVSFKNLSAFEAANYIMPITASYTANDSTSIPFLGEDQQKEYTVFLAGLDTRNANAACSWECYRVQWSPDTMELINQDLGSVTITGDLMQDLDMQANDPIMGNLGRMTINKRDVTT
jgi:hypothetical protein